MTAKIVKLTLENQSKFGLKKVKKRKKVDLEEYGQLNMFKTSPSEAKIVRFNRYLTPFEEALEADEQGRVDAAKQLYLKAIESNDCIADAYCNLGILESNSDNYLEAIDCFSRTLLHDPRHYEAHYNLANIYGDMEDHKLAEMHYRRTIELCPEFYNAYYNLALIHGVNKEYKEAITLLTRFKELAPDDELPNAEQLIHSLRISLQSKE